MSPQEIEMIWSSLRSIDASLGKLYVGLIIHALVMSLSALTLCLVLFGRKKG